MEQQNSNYMADLKYIYDSILKNSREVTKRTVLVYTLNVIKIGIFAFIAIEFRLWWVVLFSIFFQSNVPNIVINSGNEDKDD